MTDQQAKPVASDEVPQIVIRYVENEHSLIEYIGYGIEEEGVPWRKQLLEDDADQPKNSATELAYQAASDSGLKIGIGVSRDKTLTLHHARLPTDKPVLSVTHPTNSQARTTGTNAARLAKRMPLRVID